MCFKFSTLTVIRSVVVLLAMMSVSMVLQAAEVQGLYRAEVPVHGQGDAERLQAIHVGLVTVLTKVSGRREAATLALVAEALASPMRFVQQFRYHALPEEWQQAVDEQGQFYGQLLRVSYDSDAIDKVLREAALPVWGRARPSTLIWLAIEDWNQRSVLGGDNLPELRESLMHQANKRGLPVIFPLLDLQDQSALGFADIWGDFQEDILQASSRYQAGGVLVGRLYRQSADEWQARWTMYQQGDVQQWMTEGLQQQQVLVAGMDGAADIFAERFARMPGESSDSRVAVLVHDVTTLEAYARVMKYIESLGLAKDVLVEQLAANSVTFSLTVRGALQGLEQAILFGDTLAPVIATPGLNAVEVAPADNSGVMERPVLSYRLLP